MSLVVVRLWFVPLNGSVLSEPLPLALDAASEVQLSDGLAQKALVA